MKCRVRLHWCGEGHRKVLQDPWPPTCRGPGMSGDRNSWQQDLLEYIALHRCSNKSRASKTDTWLFMYNSHYFLRAPFKHYTGAGWTIDAMLKRLFLVFFQSTGKSHFALEVLFYWLLRAAITSMTNRPLKSSSRRSLRKIMTGDQQLGNWGLECKGVLNWFIFLLRREQPKIFHSTNGHNAAICQVSVSFILHEFYSNALYI